MSEQEQHPEIHIDEDWKSRVKAEDAALDEKLRDDSADKAAATAPPPQAEQPQPRAEKIGPLPPANFSMLVSMFTTQAMVGLGVLPNPVSNKAEPQPELAKHFIDLLGMLEEKTKGNLDDQEAELLDSTLHQLRMAFVATSRNPE